MKKIGACVLLCALLAGCSGGNGEVQDVAAGPSFSEQMAYLILPDKVSFGFHFELVNERLYTKKNGETRRGITMEVLDADAKVAMDRFAEGFGRGGYKAAGEPRVGKKGVIARSFSKKGAPSVYVQVTPTPAGKSENSAAQSIAWISWQVRPADAK